MKALSFNVGQYDTPAVLSRDVACVAELSPRAHVRLDAVWRYCSDPSGKVYNFTSLDAKVNTVVAAGLGVRFMIPMWAPDGVLAGAPDKTQIKTGAALSSYTAFVKALGLRYADRVKGASLGNECNIQQPFAPDGADPAWQATVTNSVVPVLPKHWKLYSPGMAPSYDVIDPSGFVHSLSPLTYLTRYWAKLNPRVALQLHGVEIHPYGRAADVTQAWSTLGMLRSINTLTSKPIDASEYNDTWQASDAQKAIDVPLGLDYLAGLPFVERVFIYAMSDKVTEATPPGYHLGLIDSAGNKRPVYGAIETWINEHQGKG